MPRAIADGPLAARLVSPSRDNYCTFACLASFIFSKVPGARAYVLIESSYIKYIDKKSKSVGRDTYYDHKPQRRSRSRFLLPEAASAVSRLPAVFSPLDTVLRPPGMFASICLLIRVDSFNVSPSPILQSQRPRSFSLPILLKGTHTGTRVYTHIYTLSLTHSTLQLPHFPGLAEAR